VRCTAAEHGALLARDIRRGSIGGARNHAISRQKGVTISLGAGGKLDAMYWSGSTSNTTQVLFDVTGYFS
jgi:hypothetical protein